MSEFPLLPKIFASLPGWSRRAALVLPAVLALAVAASAQPVAPPADGVDPCAAGLRLFEARDYRGAEPLLQKCLLAGPRAEPLVALAAIASLSGRASLAGEYAARAVELDGSSADARYWLGRALLERGDKAGAQKEWEQGLALSTEHPGLLEGLARLAAERGESAKAYGLLSQIVRLGMAEGWTYRMLADLARRKGLWAEALRQWQSALALDGEDGQSLLTAGELAILAGDTTTAITVCQRAVAVDPGGASYGGLGEALFSARRYPEALEALQRAVQLAPEQPRHRFNLANVLEVLDRPDEADVHFQRYVELEPDDSIGRFNYGIHLDKQGRTLDALTQIDAAARLAPRMMTALVVRAELLEQLGRYPEALTDIDTLLARDPENRAKLTAWRASIDDKQRADAAGEQAGRVHLLHIVTGDTLAVRLIRRDLAVGKDFAVVATIYSSGPTAARGGDIGFVAPDDMVEPLRTAITALPIDGVTPLLETRGLYHVFKRIR